MKKILALILFIFVSTSNSSANERFIPLELFTGGEIRDDTEIRFTSADTTFVKKKRKKIVGPIDWRAPGSDEIIKVYKEPKKIEKVKLEKHNSLL